MNLESCLNNFREKLLLSSDIRTKNNWKWVGFEEFIIRKCFQRLEPTGKKKPQGHFEGNIPVEFEGVVISMI